MKYKCQFPNCEYSCENRHAIHLHHIVPIENGGVDTEYNRLWVCPNHHNKIYIPESKKGIHSKKCKDSIILISKFKSTSGMILEYINDVGIHNFYEIK